MSRRKTLLVIDPSVSFPEDTGVARVVGDWPGAVRCSRPVLTPGNGPRPGDGYDVDGVVLMGSRASVHDAAAWQRDLWTWLDPILRGEIERPLLGICYGHQVLAHLLGGTVGPVGPGDGKELGLHATCVSGSRLFPDRASMRVVVSHREDVKTVPPGFRVVARRSRVPVDGMEHERLPLFSVQFHPEAREEFLAVRGVDVSDVDSRVFDDADALLAAFRRFVLER